MGIPQPFHDDAPLRRGAKVEVRTRFEGAWAGGYEVVAANRQGVRVRRHSDGYEIPRTFTAGDIRSHDA